MVAREAVTGRAAGEERLRAGVGLIDGAADETEFIMQSSRMKSRSILG
jgi:hypothetical protein